MKTNMQHSMGALFLCASLSVLNACAVSPSTTQRVDTKARVSDTKGPISTGTVTSALAQRQVTYNAAYVINGEDVTINGGTYKSSLTNQNVFLVINGGSLHIKNATIKKKKDTNKTPSTSTSEEDALYGLNASVVVVGTNSRATIENCTFSSQADDAPALVATDQASLTIAQSEIVTSGRASRALCASLGASIRAKGISITTDNVNSEAVYSRGDISLENVRINAKKGAALKVEGDGSLSLTKSNVTAQEGSVAQLSQSQGEGVSLSLHNTRLHNASTQPLYNVENACARILMEDCTIKNNTDVLLLASASQPHTLSIEASGQNLSGDIHCDPLYTSTLTLSNSLFNGRVSEGTSIVKDDKK